jgi:adenylylsulfate kinase
MELNNLTQSMGETAKVIWLTGYSGAGKSTVATGLRQALLDAGCQASILDGDIVRTGLCSDLSFSETDRKENVRRIGEVSKLLMDAGVFCIVAIISPRRHDRDNVRRLFQTGEFIEVFVNAPLAVCESRDVKGLYAQAREGLIKNFTGITSPYEFPQNPEITLETDKQTAPESVQKILDFLTNQAAGK